VRVKTLYAIVSAARSAEALKAACDQIVLASGNSVPAKLKVELVDRLGDEEEAIAKAAVEVSSEAATSETARRLFIMFLQ